MKKYLVLTEVELEEATKARKSNLGEAIARFVASDAKAARAEWRGSYVAAKSLANALKKRIKTDSAGGCVRVRCLCDEVYLIKTI